MSPSDIPSPQSRSAAPPRLLDTLHRVTRFLSEVTDLRRLLTLVMVEAKGALDTEASSCMLYDEASDELHFEVAMGERSELVKSVRLKRGQGFGGICLADGQTLLVNDVRSDPRHDTRADAKSGFVTRNLIAVPMRHHGRMMGVLEAVNKRGGASFDSEDVEILEMMADQAALAIANARLVEISIQRERMAAVGMAVSGVAHHLKNIILSVKAPVSLIRMGLDAKNEQMTRESLEIIARASQRMEQSVGEMLTFGKEREPELEHGSLNALAGEIARDSSDRAKARGVEMRLELDPAIQPSWIDRLRLHDAILNLVGNAIEAHPESARTAPAAQDAGTAGPWVALRTRLSHEGALYLVEVEDNGSGIPPEVLARIFQPFFSTKGSRGTGLGLAVVQKIAEENGGTIAVRSALGQGTCFTLHLPVVTEVQGTKTR
jgi:signal transduction histidine kinase